MTRFPARAVETFFGLAAILKKVEFSPVILISSMVTVPSFSLSLMVSGLLSVPLIAESATYCLFEMSVCPARGLDTSSIKVIKERCCDIFIGSEGKVTRISHYIKGFVSSTIMETELDIDDFRWTIGCGVNL